MLLSVLTRSLWFTSVSICPEPVIPAMYLCTLDRELCPFHSSSILLALGFAAVIFFAKVCFLLLRCLLFPLLPLSLNEVQRLTVENSSLCTEDELAQGLTSTPSPAPHPGGRRWLSPFLFLFCKLIGVGLNIFTFSFFLLNIFTEV